MKPFGVRVLGGILAALLFLSSSHARAKGKSTPNVLFVLTDDQGYGDLSCHSNPVLKTPNLDRLHDQSIRFTDFHVAPMCTPSRGQLMTGVDALRNGAMNVSSGRTLLRREFPTMPEIFKANGYRTALFGKWHLGDNYPYRPQDRGFEESIWFPSSHESSAADYFNNDYFDDVYYHNGKREAFQGYCTDLFARKAMDWMKQCADAKKPFFCYLPFNAPHAPLYVPDRYRDPYRNQKKNAASFFGMIACIDENMGKIAEFLRKNNLEENTIVIFMTDNGTAGGDSVFNAGMRGRKMSLYEGGHRVPFFIRWPGGKLRTAGDVNALTESQDLLPTLVDLCQLRSDYGVKFDGVSLAGLLQAETNALADRMVVSQFSRMAHAQPEKSDAVVMWNKWRLVAGQELYNLDNDASQQHDVHVMFPDVVGAMRRHYDEWWSGVTPQVNEFSRIHIGTKLENPVLLTPCDWRDVFLDQQTQIRKGLATNGVWNLFIERAGQYEFSLRRWPVEADLPIIAPASEYRGVDGVYHAGEALPVTEARMKISGQKFSTPVTEADREIKFTLRLKHGQAELQTSFRDKQGRELCGAYYVYVNGPK